MDDLEKKHRCQGHADIGERHARLQSPVAVCSRKLASLGSHTIPLSSSCLVFLLLRSTGCPEAENEMSIISPPILSCFHLPAISSQRRPDASEEVVLAHVHA